MTSPTDAKRDGLGFLVDPHARLEEIRRNWNVDDTGSRMDIADNDIDWLIERVEQLDGELERLRQRETAMRRAIAHEHQRSNGSSVYMQGPPQHERSRMTCKHPLCAAVAQAEQPDA